MPLRNAVEKGSGCAGGAGVVGVLRLRREAPPSLRMTAFEVRLFWSGAGGWGWDGAIGLVETEVEVVGAAGAEAVDAVVFCWGFEVEGSGHEEVAGVAWPRGVGCGAGVFEGIEGDTEGFTGAAEGTGGAVGHVETDGAECAC